jgi:hypothetical protein
VDSACRSAGLQDGSRAAAVVEPAALLDEEQVRSVSLAVVQAATDCRSAAEPLADEPAADALALPAEYAESQDGCFAVGQSPDEHSVLAGAALELCQADWPKAAAEAAAPYGYCPAGLAGSQVRKDVAVPLRDYCLDCRVAALRSVDLLPADCLPGHSDEAQLQGLLVEELRGCCLLPDDCSQVLLGGCLLLDGCLLLRDCYLARLIAERLQELPVAERRGYSLAQGDCSRVRRDDCSPADRSRLQVGYSQVLRAAVLLLPEDYLPGLPGDYYPVLCFLACCSLPHQVVATRRLSAYPGLLRVRRVLTVLLQPEVRHEPSLLVAAQPGVRLRAPVPHD